MSSSSLSSSQFKKNSKYKRKRRRNNQPPSSREKWLGVFVLAASGMYLCVLWKVQSLLDRLETTPGRIPSLLRNGITELEHVLGRNFTKSLAEMEKEIQNRIHQPLHILGGAGAASGVAVGEQDSRIRQKDTTVENATSPEEELPKRYILFNGFMGGQGIGNVMNGLLAAHLLGNEFHRIVCVGKKFADFHLAFEPILPEVIADCPAIAQRWHYAQPKDTTIKLNNFGTPPDECRVQRLLASGVEVILVSGNTYPRWPQVPDNFFKTHYKAKPGLLKMLAYDPATNPPETVVHLRAPDGSVDVRKGLDESSFEALGRRLPKDTFLVTNKVEWFDYFELHYGWRHPEWQTVAHSAFASKNWGLRLEGHRDEKRVDTSRQRQKMQMWADWYTLLNAKSIYHTHSDFSVSAIHWQNIPSKSIEGLGEYVEESWRVDGVTVPIADRRVETQEGELRSCSEAELQRRRVEAEKEHDMQEFAVGGRRIYDLKHT